MHLEFKHDDDKKVKFLKSCCQALRMQLKAQPYIPAGSDFIE